MDKHIHIDSMRRNLGITLKDVSGYNSANREEIEHIEAIFDLQGNNKEKVLALLYLLASGKNNNTIQSYREQTGLQSTQYDNTSVSITKYNLMLVTALIYDKALYTMAVNYYGAVSAGLPVGIVEEKAVTKRIRTIKDVVVSFPKTVKITIAAAAAAVIVFFSQIIPSTNTFIQNLIPQFASTKNNNVQPSVNDPDPQEAAPFDDTGVKIAMSPVTGEEPQANLSQQQTTAIVPPTIPASKDDPKILKELTSLNDTSGKTLWKDIQNTYSYLINCFLPGLQELPGGISIASASPRSNPTEISDEFKEKKTEYTEAFNANPNDYDACMNLVFLYMSQDGIDAKNVLEFSNKALDIKKEDPLALYARGMAYYRRGDISNALNDLNAVLEMNNVRYKELIYYVISWICYNKGKDKEFREAFEACRAINPEFADANKFF